MRLSVFLLFACFQLYSQTSDSLYISSYENYPLNKEVKIFFDEQGRPVTEIDSAFYYRLVTFEKPNVPKGRVDDYFISGMVTKLDITRPVTNYQYEEKIQNKKRDIFVLKQEYVSVVLDDIEDIMPYKKGSTEYVDRTLKRAENIRLYQ